MGISSRSSTTLPKERGSPQNCTASRKARTKLKVITTAAPMTSRSPALTHHRSPTARAATATPTATTLLHTQRPKNSRMRKKPQTSPTSKRPAKSSIQRRGSKVAICKRRSKFRHPLEGISSQWVRNRFSKKNLGARTATLIKCTPLKVKGQCLRKKGRWAISSTSPSTTRDLGPSSALTIRTCSSLPNTQPLGQSRHWKRTPPTSDTTPSTLETSNKIYSTPILLEGGIIQCRPAT